MNKIIELLELISIEIDDDNNVLRWIPKWDPENDEISVYSESLNAVLETDYEQKEFDAEYVSFWGDDLPDDLPEDTNLYILHLFDPHIIPPPHTGKHRKSRNKAGAWCSVLFTEQTFQADFSYWNITDSDFEYCSENVNNLKYSTMNISEFLKTEQANYIRDISSSSNPHEPQYNWQRM